MLCLVRLAKLGQRSQLSDAAPQINKILTAAIPLKTPPDFNIYKILRMPHDKNGLISL